MSDMGQTLLAALGATVCLALLVHMFLPAASRRRIDDFFRRIWHALRHRRSGVPRPARRTDLRAANQPRADDRRSERWPARNGRTTGRTAERTSDSEVQREAEQEALAVIERVRRQAREGKPVARDGNVYRPDAFKPRPPEDKLH